MQEKATGLEAQLDQAHTLLDEWKSQLITLQEKLVDMDKVRIDIFGLRK